MTDIGRFRKSQDDAVPADDRLGLFVVADGMGEPEAAARAARLACESIRAHVDVSAVVDPGERLSAAVLAANQQLLEAGASDESPSGLSTTAAAVLAAGRELVIARVGEDRAYRLRGLAFEQLTFVDEERRRLFEDWRRAHEEQNQLGCILPPPVAALGSSRVELQLARHDARVEDLVLLCTDGLYGMVDTQRMRDILIAERSLSTAASALVQAANQAGGRDNIGVVLARL